MAKVKKEVPLHNEGTEAQFENIKSEHRTLRYDYTQEEMNDLSKHLAENTKKLVSVKEEKGSVVAQYTARVKEVESKNNVLSNQISDGWEHRDVVCEVKYHQPVEGKKTITRVDTFESWEEKMEAWEFNLFTQPFAEGDEGDEGDEDLNEAE
jgi:hypothetical protein